MVFAAESAEGSERGVLCGSARAAEREEREARRRSRDAVAIVAEDRGGGGERRRRRRSEREGEKLRQRSVANDLNSSIRKAQRMDKRLR